jgi:hypothetical protein
MIPTSLNAELSASPGRFVLIDARAGADEVIGEWEQMLGTTRCSVGARLTSLAEPPSSRVIEALLRPDPLLVDIEVLFAPELAVDPLMLLRRLARISSPRLALWPGSLAAGRARFSEPQLQDHYDRPVEDVIILRPVPRSFPDEPCFEIERWLN